MCVSERHFCVVYMGYVDVNQQVYMCAGVMTVFPVCYSIKESGEEACKELMEAFAACVKSNAEAS